MRRVLSASLAVIVILGMFVFLKGAATAAPPAVCPPVVGSDTDCGTIITLTNSGTSVSAAVTSTGQGPYDSIEDTLVGVVNNTTKPINALGLTSANVSAGGIFAFDGDGITSFGVLGNPQDPTGYGGPNAYYTNISPNATAGIVDFITPIAPGGGTSYFSLENTISQHSCADVVNNAVLTPTISPNGTQISTTFTPNFGYSITDAAAFCGVTNFDFQQTITNLPSPSPFLQAGTGKSLFAPPSFLDPPPGGYTFQTPADNAYPFFYDPRTSELALQENTTTLSFLDVPADNCLPGGTGLACGGHTASAGSLAFTTHLVGVNADLSALDLGIGFTWTSTFNGTAGGLATTKNAIPTDSGSGTGVAAVTSVTSTTTYQYFSGIVVTGVNPSIVYLPIVLNQAANGQGLAISPVLPAVAHPTPTVLRRIPIPDQKSR